MLIKLYSKSGKNQLDRPCDSKTNLPGVRETIRHFPLRQRIIITAEFHCACVCLCALSLQFFPLTQANHAGCCANFRPPDIWIHLLKFKHFCFCWSNSSPAFTANVIYANFCYYIKGGKLLGCHLWMLRVNLFLHFVQSQNEIAPRTYFNFRKSFRIPFFTFFLSNFVPLSANAGQKKQRRQQHLSIQQFGNCFQNRYLFIICMTFSSFDTIA